VDKEDNRKTPHTEKVSIESPHSGRYMLVGYDRYRAIGDTVCMAHIEFEADETLRMEDDSNLHLDCGYFPVLGTVDGRPGSACFTASAALTERGIWPFPMIYGARERMLPLGHAPTSLERRTLAEFQRWAIRRYYTVVDFADYDVSARDRRTRADACYCSAACRQLAYRARIRFVIA